ncbi:MAG: dynamin family protein [Bacteroidales bacterium]|nr:dynamin family protein [Bacteroidales bacterium]
MKTLELLKQKVEKAAAVAKDKLPVADSVAMIGQDAASLAKRISEDKYVKIPFVGDFGSGKSSLLNSFLGRDILPTNILPETAVAYEIYFSENERLELVADGNVKKTSSSLDDIKTFSVTPSDIVRVYVNNADVKSLNDKGVVLVDMPGIDSGIEAHNNAILNYIKEGTVFMLFNDAENGTLRSSTVSFINEIKQYGLSVHLFVSKADKKPADEIAQIKAQFEQTAKALIKADAQVGVTSAVDSSYGFKDVLAVLQQIDGGRILEEKYQTEVNAFVDSIISQFELQIKLTLSDKKDFDEMLDKLSDKKREAVAQLEAKSASAQPIDGSVDDIITDVRQALMRNSQRLAVLALNSNGNTSNFEGEVMSIIRPVLIESFKREMTEYNDALGECVRNLSVDLSSILNEKTKGEIIASDLIVKMGGPLIIEQLLKKLLAKLTLMVAGKVALTWILRILSPVVTIIVSLLPDIIRLIFGKSQSEKISEIQQKIESEVIGQLVEKLRPNVTEMLTQTRKEAYDEIAAQMENTLKQIDDSIKSIMSEKEASEAEIKQKVDTLNSAIADLKAA